MGMVPNIGWAGGAAKGRFGMEWALWVGGARWLLVAVVAAASCISESGAPGVGMGASMCCTMAATS